MATTKKKATKQVQPPCDDALQCAVDGTCATHLCVFFHGLWLFEERADKIIAHTTVQEDHKFLAVGLQQSGHNLPAGRLVLKGVDPVSKRKKFQPGKNLIPFGASVGPPDGNTLLPVRTVRKRWCG
jgi:hypothetical protein